MRWIFLLLFFPGCAWYDRECTAFPEGQHSHCCLEHDEAYHAGGTDVDRLAADDEFHACMMDYFPEKQVDAIYQGIREAGWLWWGK